MTELRAEEVTIAEESAALEAPVDLEVQKDGTTARIDSSKEKTHRSRNRDKPAKTSGKQEVLQFEPVTRGRFEKSEPTIVEGQDLDVPTFLRKNMRVK